MAAVPLTSDWTESIVLPTEPENVDVKKSKKSAHARDMKNRARNEKRSRDALEKDVETKKQKYARGSNARTKGIKDKKQRAVVQKSEQRYEAALASAARAEILLPEQAG
jgi:hypothetical protein